MRPSRPARLLAAGGVALLALAVAGAPPASAHAPTGAWTAPTPDEGAQLDAAPTLQGTFDHPDPATHLGIEKVTVILRDAEGEKVDGGTYEVAGGGQEQVTFSWPAASFPVVPNGTYSAAAEAVTQAQTLPPHAAEEGELPARSFFLAIPPATPTGLRAATTGGGAQVGLVWNANTEPDLMGYLVERRLGDGAYSEVAWTWAAAAHEAGGKSGLAGFTDSPPSSGAYGYRVVAVRCQGTYDDKGACIEVLRSSKSASVTATATVAATPTTTAPNQGPATTVAGSSPPRGVDLSRFGALRSQANRSTPRPTEPDTGFSQLLPFGARPDDTGDDEGDGGDAALADELLGDDVADERALLIPVAFALILFVFALQLRWLMHHVGEPLPAVWPADAATAVTGEQLVIPGLAQVREAGRWWRRVRVRLLRSDRGGTG